MASVHFSKTDIRPLRYKIKGRGNLGNLNQCILRKR